MDRRFPIEPAKKGVGFRKRSPVFSLDQLDVLL
jgi:hypothetical protein